MFKHVVKSDVERVLGKLVSWLKLQMVKWALHVLVIYGNILNYFSYYHIKVLICIIINVKTVHRTNSTSFLFNQIHMWTRFGGGQKTWTSREFSPTLHTLCHMPSGVQDNIRFYFNSLVISSDPLLGWRYQQHSHIMPPTRPSLICIVNEPGHLELASSQTQAPLLWIVLFGASLQAWVSVTVGSEASSVRLALHIKQCQQVPACNWIIRSCWAGGVDQTDLAGLAWRTEEGWAWERIFVLFLS